MREKTLKQFFEGRISASALAADVAGSTKHLGSREFAIEIEDMSADFRVSRQMLIHLCDAALAGQFPPDNLHEIGFALMASDLFFWDEDDLLADVIFDWSCPEVNYPLTMENVERFRRWLQGEEPSPSKLPLATTADSTVISVTSKKFIRPWWRRFFPSR